MSGPTKTFQDPAGQMDQVTAVLNRADPLLWRISTKTVKFRVGTFLCLYQELYVAESFIGQLLPNTNHNAQ